MAFHPYLNFGGNCREAFTRYHEILGGELFVMTMAEMPSDEPTPAEMADLIMHVSLTVDGNVLMGSDDPTGGFDGVKGMHVSYTLDDVAEAERVFAALAEGGQATMPIGETFWAKRFGMCVDRFGTPWMVDVGPDGPPPS